MKRNYDLKPITRSWYTKAEKVYVDAKSGIKIYRFKNAWEKKWNMTDKFNDDSTVWYSNPTKAIKAYLELGDKAIKA